VGGVPLRVVCTRYGDGLPAELRLYNLATNRELAPATEAEIAAALRR
jgi:hypothetical protein